jgi:predicted RNA binding protein YcfA (HicA-like mRNA interferase family)
MSVWGAAKARRVFRALQHIGWKLKRNPGSSHRVLERPGWPDYTFAFHDGEEIGPNMLAKIAKQTGLRPEDL